MRLSPIGLVLVGSIAAAAVLGAAGAPVPPAGSAEKIFARGNDAYARGDFPGAEGEYRRIVDTGVRNGRVYFNLANALFRQDRVGEAILYYEKARRIDPSDPDIQENLRFAGMRIRDRRPADPAPYLVAVFERLRDSVPSRLVSAVFAGAYLLSMALTTVWILGSSRRWGPGAGIAALGLLAVALATGGWMVLQERAREARDEAVILAPKLEMVSGPGAENTLLASVHEGTRVHLRGERGEWAQVVLPDGRAGWVRKDGLGVI